MFDLKFAERFIPKGDDIARGLNRFFLAIAGLLVVGFGCFFVALIVWIFG